ALGRSFVGQLDAAELGRAARADERRERGPRAAGAAGEQRLERAPLLGGGGLVDDDGLDPAAVDHAARGVEGDHGARPAERHAAELALVDPDRPVPCAAFVRAVLAEVHVARAHERAGAVLEDEPASEPRPSGVVGHRHSCGSETSRYTPGSTIAANPSATSARLPRPASGRERPVTRASSPRTVAPALVRKAP